jgi:lipopolysaccharide assembly outer membrane protein LptD (OstA)
MNKLTSLVYEKKKKVLCGFILFFIIIILFSTFSSFSIFAQEQEQISEEVEGEVGQDEDSEVEITAEQVDYDKENDQMIFSGNVTVLQEDTTLTSRQANFNVDTKIGQIEGDVQLVQEDITITGTNLEAFLNDKKYIFENEVRLVQVRKGDEEEEDEDVVWTCNRLEILTETKDMTAIGNVEISKTDYIIRAEEAVYDDQEEKITLKNKVRIEELESNRWIEGDNAIFYLDTDKLEVKGNVRSSMILD